MIAGGSVSRHHCWWPAFNGYTVGHEQRRDLQRNQPFRLRASRRKGAVLDRVGQGLAEHFALPGVQVGQRGRRDVEPRSIAVLSRPIQ